MISSCAALMAAWVSALGAGNPTPATPPRPCLRLPPDVHPPCPCPVPCSSHPTPPARLPAEHMFFATAERIAAVRRMIAAEELGVGADGADGGAGAGSSGAATAALAALKEFQREDFEGIFEAMDGLPVTIRLLDPPLHEFLPAEGTPELEALCEGLAQEMAGRAGQRESVVCAGMGRGWLGWAGDLLWQMRPWPAS